MNKKMYKSLSAILIAILAYLINRFGDGLFDAKVMVLITILIVLVTGMYLVHANSKGLDKNNTQQLIFFVMGLGLTLYGLYGLVMAYALSSYRGF